jgi:hypothetical protein
LPWIRLSDNYIDNPKISALNDGAFRLWHEGMAYTRRHQTDGVIPFAAMRKLGAYTTGREKQLATPYIEGANPLWVLIPKTGYKVHDYLAWNPSREEENEDRASSKERMRLMRERRLQPGTPAVREMLQRNNERNTSVTNAFVPEREREGIGVLPEKGTGEKPSRVITAEDLGDRARWLLESYPVWFQQERGGARLRILFNTLQFQEALSICETWSEDARLEKLARLVLTTDDEFISRTDRGWKIFVLKASWADDRLRQWEQQSGVAV